MTNKARLDANAKSTASTPASSNRSIPAMIEKFVIRLPNGLRTQIKELSENNRRSMNSEIIMVLEKHIQQNHSDDFLADFADEHIRVDDADGNEEVKESELNKRLESLTAEKKEALLELLG